MSVLARARARARTLARIKNKKVAKSGAQAVVLSGAVQGDAANYCGMVAALLSTRLPLWPH